MSAALPHPSMTVEEFATVRKNSLRGFAKIMLPSGMILTDVSIHVSDGKAWASPPSKPMLSREGVHLRDDAGKPRYTPIVAFASRKLRDRFSQQVVEAIRISHPDALS